MNYKFPTIEHISQVEKVIKDLPEIPIIDKGDYKVIAYRLSTPELFPSVDNEEMAIRRECRGLIFDKSGKIISRPYHKFFNVNEKEETFINKINISEPHIILSKLDGSMITAILLNGKIELCTKRGITDISNQAKKFIEGKENYNDFILDCIESGITPIFEWCSSQNRIILDYPDSLIVTGMRHNITGEYLHYSSMRVFCQQYDIPYVGAYSGTVQSMNHLIDNIREMTGIEGYVLRFDTGQMCKIKCEWYVTLHKTKDQIRFEKDIVKMILEEYVDDIKPFLLESDLNRVNNFEVQFEHGIMATLNEVDEFKKYKNLSRPEFAKIVNEKLDAGKKFLAFALYDGKDIYETLKNVILKHTSSQSGLLKVKQLYNADYFNIGEENE